MATLQDVARQRKAQLKQLMLASRKLDAAQESLEREVKRLINRKGSVPEVADASRIVALAKGVESSLSNMVSLLASLSTSWGTI